MDEKFLLYFFPNHVASHAVKNVTTTINERIEEFLIHTLLHRFNQEIGSEGNKFK